MGCPRLFLFYNKVQYVPWCCLSWTSFLLLLHLPYSSILVNHRGSVNHLNKLTSLGVFIKFKSNNDTLMLPLLWAMHRWLIPPVDHGNHLWEMGLSRNSAPGKLFSLQTKCLHFLNLFFLSFFLSFKRSQLWKQCLVKCYLVKKCTNSL